MSVREMLEEQRDEQEARARELLRLMDRLPREKVRYWRKLDETADAVAHLVVTERLLALDDIALLAQIADDALEFAKGITEDEFNVRVAQLRGLPVLTEEGS